MLGQFEPEPLGDGPLPPLDVLVAEFLDPPAFQAQDMVVMLALIEFEYRLTTLEMMALDQPRRLELGQHPVYGRQPDLLAGIDQRPIDRLGGQMGAFLMLQHVEYLHARQGDLQASLFEFFRAHAELSGIALTHGLPLYVMMWPSSQATRTLPSMLHSSLRAAGVLLLVLTAGCESYLPSFYKVPVRQGNYFDQAMIEQVRPGMTKQQVQRILGTPLIADPFHQNRWDYYYHFKKGGEITERRHITLFFSGDVLDRIDDGAANPAP